MNFLGFRVDPVHRVVTTPRGRVVRLEPKAFDLLLYFTQHPEETISRERLIADVWDGKFVTDDAVMVAVYALRQAFEDDSRAPKFIETIRGRGYRWIATHAVAPERSKRRGFLAAVFAVMATGFAGALVWGLVHPPQPMPSIKRASEVVRGKCARRVFQRAHDAARSRGGARRVPQRHPHRRAVRRAARRAGSGMRAVDRDRLVRRSGE